MPRLISIYIFKEILTPFLLSAGILTATIILSSSLDMVDLVVTYGVGPSTVLWFLLSTVPNFLVDIIPISFLIAVLVAFARLSSESEIIALKGSGVGLFTLIKPVLVMSIAVYLLTLVISLHINPWGNKNLKKIMFEVARTATAAGIEEQTFFWTRPGHSRGFKGVVLYVDHFAEDNETMRGVFISQKEEDGTKSVILAESGLFVPSSDDVSISLILEDGTIHRSREGSTDYNLATFDKYTLALDLAEGRRPGRPTHETSNRELYVGELREKIKVVAAKNWPSLNKDILDLHKRFSMPAAVFVFAILGIPLGIQKVRSAKLTGFSVAIAVVLIYYLISKQVESLGKSGLINPVLAAWMPNIVLGAIGAYIFYRAAIDRPVGVMKAIEDLYGSICEIFKKKRIGESKKKGRGK